MQILRIIILNIYLFVQTVTDTYMNNVVKREILQGGVPDNLISFRTQNSKLPTTKQQKKYTVRTTPQKGAIP